jgi:signal transduction histidine kinase
LARYSIVPLAVVAAVAVRGLLWPVLGPGLPFLFMWPALLVAACYGGFRSGALATLLAALAEAYFVFEPRFSFVVSEPAEVFGIGLFILLGLVVSSRAEWSHRARQKAEREVERRRKAEQSLREADRHKDEMLAVVAHELRGPLAAIVNSLHLLGLQGTPGPNGEAARQMIQRQTRQLTRLAEDLLDVSRVKQGKVTLQKQPVELQAIIAQAIETTAPLLDARRHHLVVSVPTEPIRLDADAGRLVQVFGNLLTNAAKYQNEGGCIWLTARQEGDEVVVGVRDRGIGIPPALLPRVFELFTQVNSRAPGGLGIGLALVRSLVELHGGRALAHSEGPGRGSEFTVRLPALPVAATRKEGETLGSH